MIITGCEDIDAQQRAAYLRLNKLTEAQAEELSRFCRGKVDGLRLGKR